MNEISVMKRPAFKGRWRRKNPEIISQYISQLSHVPIKRNRFFFFFRELNIETLFFCVKKVKGIALGTQVETPVSKLMNGNLPLPFPLGSFCTCDRDLVHSRCVCPAGRQFESLATNIRFSHRLAKAFAS